MWVSEDVQQFLENYFAVNPQLPPPKLTAVGYDIQPEIAPVLNSLVHTIQQILSVEKPHTVQFTDNIIAFTKNKE